MRIPSNFVVPDFILEHVRVAPDDWPEALDKMTAYGRLKELMVALQNPDILHAMGVMVYELASADATIDNQTFTGVHDVYNQQQLIGEKRGLRRFFAELETIREKLAEKAK